MISYVAVLLGIMKTFLVTQRFYIQSKFKVNSMKCVCGVGKNGNDFLKPK